MSASKQASMMYVCVSMRKRCSVILLPPPEPPLFILSVPSCVVNFVVMMARLTRLTVDKLRGLRARSLRSISGGTNGVLRGTGPTDGARVASAPDFKQVPVNIHYLLYNMRTARRTGRNIYRTQHNA
jgi:hypothetical protein